ncbi:MAG: hypothetical protein L3J51_05090 [Cocleimonas sp.]|nr:hypothetical protein [Cocleimonas sp.]
MHFKTLFSVIVASLFLTACGGGGSSSNAKKLSCSSTHSGDLIPDCDTESTMLKSGVESLDIVKGKRTETVNLNCTEGSVAGTSIADYNSGEVSIDVTGTNGDISCKMYFTSPLAKTITTQDIDELLEWGDDPADRTSTTCPDDVLDNDSSDITEDMIKSCSGSLQVDFEFTDSNEKEHEFTLKYTIK